MSDELRLYVPIEKVDKEKRTVAGWATTEEVDKQNEVVDYNGSKIAFNDWQGNIREMHEPKAVGKAVEIIPDDENKRIWVKAYISKGAEDTWQKIKDGTLGGFSIGGQTIHKTTQIVKDLESLGSKTVTRITKYKLNELSLVDNPANPECAFELVKSVGGVPYQTQLVEDDRKVVVTEAEDPLSKEVTEHRSKADALIRKVLDRDEMEKLGDNDFAIVRKNRNGNTITKERLLPMPDKVHAVRALEIYKNYGLTPEEEDLVHEKAEEVLGSAYENHRNLNRGGEDKVNTEKIDKLAETVTSLAKTVENLVKAFEGAYRPIPGTKKHPNAKDEEPTSKSDAKPELGENAPYDPQGDVADTNTRTQPEEGAYPNEQEKPIGTNKAADPANAVRTQREQAVPVDANDRQTETRKEATRVESTPASEDQSAPAAVNRQHPSTVQGKTQPEEGAYPNESKGPIKQVESVREDEEEDKTKKRENYDDETERVPSEQKETVETRGDKTQKSAGSEKELAKLESNVESLRKRFDEMLGQLKQPKPRKIKIEKNFDGDSANSESQKLQKDMATVQEWQKSGKPLTPDQEKFKDEVVNKMLSSKFGS